MNINSAVSAKRIVPVPVVIPLEYVAGFVWLLEVVHTVVNVSLSLDFFRQMPSTKTKKYGSTKIIPCTLGSVAL